jgi:hypothetical protein
LAQGFIPFQSLVRSSSLPFAAAIVMLLFCAVLRSLISKRFLLAGHSGKSSFFVDGYLVGKAETVPNVLTAIGSAINLSCLPSTVSTPLILSHFGAYRQAMTPEQVQTLSTWREAAVDPYVQVSFFFTFFFPNYTAICLRSSLITYPP